MMIKAKANLFRDLLYIQEVINHRQISAAAIKNGIKPSNLSKIINNFESITGKKLFVRRTHGVIPTDEAKNLSNTIINLEKCFNDITENVYHSKVTDEIKLYLPVNLNIQNLTGFQQAPISVCNEQDKADVIVSYEPPLNSANLVTIENRIGQNFTQNIWVSSINEEKPLALARFIISAMHY